ncbi:hypothetical protein ACIP5Y_24540 [Nocardia sp. NPDC088792]|uniref:hypothetical protein n=1 Tax=Nocardia sp. NPDC088792 TaxID=3364332 RepID=UPI00380F8485
MPEYDIADTARRSGLLTLPALGLAIISLLLARTAHRPAVTRLAIAAGLIAAVISLTQCLLGFLLSDTTAPGTAHALFEALNRLDGVKMFALIGLATAAAISGLLPRWLRYMSIALTVAIVASGIAYLLMLQPLAFLADISGVLLLIVIAALGIVLGLRERGAAS